VICWPPPPAGRVCLARDADGAPVLVYDNVKAHRLGRRLPVSQATAMVITAQQARVRARFPATQVSELRLLPAPRADSGSLPPPPGPRVS
jgi:hypothetical protein